MVKDSREDQIIALLKFADGWRLVPGGSSREAFPSLEDAQSETATLIRLAEGAGLNTTLLIHDEFGRVTELHADAALAWSLGRGGALATPESDRAFADDGVG